MSNPGARDLLTISREIAAIAQAGQAYTRDDFDRDRFGRLREIASELLNGPGKAPGFAWPVEMGYPTPKVDVRAVVFRGDEVLLVKEMASGKWTVPGGWADVNVSPAQNAEKECREESGFVVRARTLTSLRDRDLAGYPRFAHAVYKIFFLCELVGGEARASNETSEVGFFALDNLPSLDPDRACESEIRLAHAFAKNPDRPAEFN